MSEPALGDRDDDRPGIAAGASVTPIADAAVRKSGIDNLRVGLSALVVAHHALQPYGFNQNWAVVERVPPAPGLGVLLWIDSCFFMGLFFLIAGLFTPGSVDRKGVGAYLHDRRRLLGLPLLLGLFVLLPPLGWYSHVHNRHVAWVPYPEYFVRFWLGIGGRPADWPAQRWPDVNLGQLWFVEHLLVYAFVYGAWRSLRPKPGRATGSAPGPSPGRSRRIAPRPAAPRPAAR